MTIAELLLPEFDKEIAVTRRVLERMPDDKAEWKPHDKSFPLAHLAQLVSMLPGWTAMMLDADEFDLAPKGKPTASVYSIQKISKLLTDFDEGAHTGREALARTTDAAFEEPWTLKRGGEQVQKDTRYLMLRMMVLNHIVHHRAQLALYLRMVGGEVPSMYGPTADDPR